MATKRIPRPRDPLALAKLIGDIATGQVVDAVDDGKDPQAIKRGVLGGLRGGMVRAERLSAQERQTIARTAAQKRWSKTSS
jgi:hypothetical protein